MYLPKSKYSSPKHTPGDSFLLNDKPYVGWYIELSTGEFYTGKVFDSKSVKLQIVSNTAGSNTELIESAPPFYGVKTSPSSRDIQNKTWTRYFLQDKRNSRIVEVDKERYGSFRVKPYIVRVTLDWVLQGPAENLIINGYQYYGAAHKNKAAAEALEPTMPGLSTFIKNYAEFVE